jgi:hypothetical protein
MDLDTLRALPVTDQRVFLLGRIAAETTSMDAALRLLNGALRGQYDIDAYLDAPDFFSKNARECRKLLNKRDEIDDETRKAVLRAITLASDAYTKRNRYVHDLLRDDLLDRSWELARLSRQPEGQPEFETVSFDDMVSLVLQLVTATWKLRGCALYVLNGSWSGIALGQVAGEWDGSSNFSREK